MLKKISWVAFIAVYLWQLATPAVVFGSPKSTGSPTNMILAVHLDIFAKLRQPLVAHAQEVLQLDAAAINERVATLKELVLSHGPLRTDEKSWTVFEPILKFDSYAENEKTRIHDERQRLAKLPFDQRMNLLRVAMARLKELGFQGSGPLAVEASSENQNIMGGYRYGDRPLTSESLEIQRVIEQIMMLRDIDPGVTEAIRMGVDFTSLIALAANVLVRVIHSDWTHSHGVGVTKALGLYILYTIISALLAQKKKTPGVIVSDIFEPVRLQYLRHQQNNADPELTAALNNIDPEKLSAVYETVTRLNCQMALLGDGTPSDISAVESVQTSNVEQSEFQNAVPALDYNATIDGIIAEQTKAQANGDPRLRLQEDPPSQAGDTGETLTAPEPASAPNVARH